MYENTNPQRFIHNETQLRSYKQQTNTKQTADKPEIIMKSWVESKLRTWFQSVCRHDYNWYFGCMCGCVCECLWSLSLIINYMKIFIYYIVIGSDRVFCRGSASSAIVVHEIFAFDKQRVNKTVDNARIRWQKWWISLLYWAFVVPLFQFNDFVIRACCWRLVSCWWCHLREMTLHRFGFSTRSFYLFPSICNLAFTRCFFFLKRNETGKNGSPRAKITNRLV